MGKHHLRGWSKTAIGVAVLSAVVMFVSALIDPSGESYRIALVPFLLSAVFMLAARTGITVGMIEMARQRGYDAGYADGERVAVQDAGLSPLRLVSARPRDAEAHSTG